MALVALYGADTDLRAGLTLATALWVFMMGVYSPLIGWGVFGIGGAGHTLAPDAPLYLGSPVKYIGATLLLHLLYGAIIGGLNPAWIELGARQGTSA
jgi:hypothetical protein